MVEPLFELKKRSRRARYGWALGFTVVGLGISYLISLGFPGKPLSTAPLVLIAIVLTSIFGGVGPGLFSTLLAVLGVNYLTNPGFQLSPFEAPDYVRLVTYAISALIISSISAYAGAIYNNKVDQKTEELRKTLTDVRRSQRFLDLLIESIPNMVFVKEAGNLRFVRFNRAGEKLLGYSRDQLLGKSDYDFFPEKEADFFTGRDRAVLDSHQEQDIPEEPIHTKDKGVRILHTKKVPIFDESGKPIYLLGVSEDITELKDTRIERDRSRDEVSYLERERSIRERFVSTLSHDLRTPLTAARACAELLQRFPERPAIRYQMPSKIIGHLDRVDRMIRDLLDANRIKGGQSLSLSLQSADLEALSRDVIETFRTMYGDRFVFEHSGNLLGEWDPKALARSIENLLNNAIKYGDPHGPITLRITRIRDRVRIAVHNQGKPIEPTLLKNLVQGRPFPSSSYRPSSASWGLGLTIVRGVVAAHRGSLSIRSSWQLGTTFVITIPIDSSNLTSSIKSNTSAA